jgi:hypothetical protein
MDSTGEFYKRLWRMRAGAVSSGNYWNINQQLNSAANDPINITKSHQKPEMHLLICLNQLKFDQKHPLLKNFVIDFCIKNVYVLYYPAVAVIVVQKQFDIMLFFRCQF